MKNAGIKVRNISQVLESQSIIDPNATYFGDPKERNVWYYESAAYSQVNIDIHSIWDEYRGSGIKVGVIDTQIDFRHDELSRAYDKALDYNFALGTGDVEIDPENLPGNHGTLVAGVIAAEGNNNQGAVGIAPDVTLVSYGVDYSSDSIVDQVVSALRASASLDVVNNSWIFNNNFDDNFRQKPAYEDALVHAVTEGRDGLGTVIVFAAGNSGTTSSSNYHNFQNSPYTIAVGAVDSDGGASSFSSRGANVLISAAGRDVYSTTLDNHYDSVDGTSFAAPAVSAAVALMLEANPNLGYRDVQEILAYSARRAGLKDDSGFGDGWQYNGAANHNGGGLHFNDAFGYGMLNVHDAVRLSESWTEQKTIANLVSTSTTTVSGEEMIAGVNDHLSLSFTVDSAISIEHVQLTLDFAWAPTADLDVYLISPTGTSVRLVYDVSTTGGAGKIKNFAFDSVASLGEDAAGTWTVELFNRNPDAGKVGKPASAVLTEATLTIHGDDTDPSDDTYIYTDEFGMLYSGADLDERSTLDDKDGGNDTFNGAALTQAAFIDLSGHSTSNVAGMNLLFVAGAIENAYTGDGNDVLFGSDANNVMITGRGDDTIYFSGGSDLVDGGQGSDTLFVGGSSADLTISIHASGGFLITVGAQTFTVVNNVERFVFDNAIYSDTELAAIAESGGTDVPAEQPVEDPTGGDQPIEDEPVDEAPVEPDPVDDVPVDDVPVEEDPSGDSEFDYYFYGSDARDKETGTDYADLLYGDAGNDVLTGKDGDDALYGENGNDKLRGGSGHDDLYGGNGNDRLYGGDGNDELNGGAGKDKIYGGDGDDWIRGGAGADTLRGDAGADFFVFDVSDIGSLDIIMDFNAAEGDQIVITGIQQSANTSFAFVERKSQTYLEMYVGDESYSLARLKNVNIDEVSLHGSLDELLVL